MVRVSPGDVTRLNRVDPAPGMERATIGSVRVSISTDAKVCMGTATSPNERRVQRSRVAHELPLQHFWQPDDVTCGPTCLRNVYGFYGLELELEEVISEIDRNEDGGTLALYLAISALRRGFRARLYSYDLRVLDPTWKGLGRKELTEKIQARVAHLRTDKARRAAAAYLDFLRLGGLLGFSELTPRLLREILDRDHPILAGLSATYLYRMPRERHHPVTHELVDDDVAGDPVGHFIVITGYERWGRRFVVRDPSEHVPASPDGRQVVDAQRLINAILLGDLTYDAVLLELWRGSSNPESE